MTAETLIPCFLFSLFGFIILYIIFYTWQDALYFFCMQALGNVNWFVSAERQQYILSILSKLDYYNNLSAKGKKYFFNRVVVFILNEHFFGDGIKMSDEVKVYIASCAVQITFRIRGFYIDHIQLIRVFPHSVYSRLAQHQVKGLTTGGGVMWLSWSDIQQGFAQQHDGINLGIHEMAHAFMLTLKPEERPNSFINRRISDWKKLAEPEFEHIKTGENTFFRQYGGANMYEFFAVSVECFFEEPEKFSSQYNAIYRALCIVFNQDPMNKTDDYKLG
jgi:Mlc titration factor MtfA (ptsG expression regulator)